MRRSVILFVLASPPVAHAERAAARTDPETPGCDAKLTLHPFDCASEGMVEWRVGAGAGAPRHRYADYMGTVHASARWWALDGVYLGMTQTIVFDAPAAYARNVPEASGFDDLLLEAGALDAWSHGHYGLSLIARAPTATDRLSRARSGLTIATLGSVKRAAMELFIQPSIVLRPTSRFGRSDVAEAWIVTGVGAGTALRWRIEAGIGESYRTLEPRRSGHLLATLNAKAGLHIDDFLVVGGEIGVRVDDVDPLSTPAFDVTRDVQARVFLQIGSNYMQ